ncbi:hypothetical protein GCM10009815_31850 [Nocardioides marmoribigeumensis]
MGGLPTAYAGEVVRLQTTAHTRSTGRSTPRPRRETDGVRGVDMWSNPQRAAPGAQPEGNLGAAVAKEAGDEGLTHRDPGPLGCGT